MSKRFTYDSLPTLIAEMSTRIEQLSVDISGMQEDITNILNSLSDRGALVNNRPINVNRVSEITGKTMNTIRQYVRMGLIPCYRMGQNLFFYESEIEEWMKSFKCETVEERASRTGSNIVQLGPKIK